MEGISYLAAIGSSIVSVVIVRWAFRRFDIGGNKLLRGAVAGGAILAGCLAYFLFGLLLLLVHPERSQQKWSAILDGVGFGFKLIMFATFVAALTLSRPRTKVFQKQPDGDVRERLLKARGDIQRRIENLKASPVLNYRGGVAFQSPT